MNITKFAVYRRYYAPGHTNQPAELVATFLTEKEAREKQRKEETKQMEFLNEFNHPGSYSYWVDTIKCE